MKVLTTTVARILFGLPFLFFGIGHLMNAQAMAGYVPAIFPGGAFWVYLTGAAFIVASLAILTKRWGKIASLLLALMLIIFVFTIQLPTALNPETRQFGLMNLLKDTALAGAALLMAGFLGWEEMEKKKMGQGNTMAKS